MLFTEFRFFIFFLAVFVLHWTMRKHRDRKILLLVASYVFYGAWDWRFLSLILLSTVVDYAVGLILRNPNPRYGRRFWLIVSLCVNLGVLGFFKYFNFFVTSANSILGPLSGSEIRTLQIVLPVGISFYTFQTMSYTIDIYRGRLKPITNFFDFGLFVAFFPQLVAGPIVRAATFLPQLTDKKFFDDIRFKHYFTLFLIGFLKKACIADNIGPLIENVFDAPLAYNAMSIWLATLFFAVQIYCDFSGYTDMAIAAAGLLGYQLTINFNYPYFAENIADFWRRWHISLSTWLRDYLYISLGGNRGTVNKTYRNLMLTMLLGGLWHGAGWNFIIWGGLHGIALVAHRLYRASKDVPPALVSVFSRLSPFLTFYWVCLAWIFFRSSNLSDALGMADSFVTFHSFGPKSLNPLHFLWFPAMILAHWIAMKADITNRIEKVPDLVFSASLGVAVVLVLMFVRVDYQPFIYFQF